MSPVVLKLGGSLLGQEDVQRRFQRWFSTQAMTRCLVLTGGGAHVKALRRQDALDEETAHWTSIGLMGQNAARFCDKVPHGRLVTSWDRANWAWEQGHLPFLDVDAYLRRDEAEPDHLPHSWDVSSDSIAARVAARHYADLVLIKSCHVTAGPYDWIELSRQGVVDAWFPRIASSVAKITLANLPG